VSLYQVHKLIHDRLGQFSAGAGGEIDFSGYDLSDPERAALAGDDIGALYAMGVHPVLINSYCRALGFKRDDYRAMLAPYARPTERRPRWRSS
jgi:hypothetical protein